MKHALKEDLGGKITWKYGLQGIRNARINPSRRVDRWPYARNLHCPTFILRGALSDVLSRETAKEMTQKLRHQLDGGS